MYVCVCGVICDSVKFKCKTGPGLLDLAYYVTACSLEEMSKFFNPSFFLRQANLLPSQQLTMYRSKVDKDLYKSKRVTANERKWRNYLILSLYMFKFNLNFKSTTLK